MVMFQRIPFEVVNETMELFADVEADAKLPEA
jgi:hypothetical protein